MPRRQDPLLVHSFLKISKSQENPRYLKTWDILIRMRHNKVTQINSSSECRYLSDPMITVDNIFKKSNFELRNYGNTKKGRLCDSNFTWKYHYFSWSWKYLCCQLNKLLYKNQFAGDLRRTAYGVTLTQFPCKACPNVASCFTQTSMEHLLQGGF